MRPFLFFCVAVLFTACNLGSGDDYSQPAPSLGAWNTFTISGLAQYPTVNSIAYADGAGFVAGTGTDYGNPVLARSATGGPGDWIIKELTPEEDGLEHYDSFVGKIRRLNDKFLITRGSGVKYGLVTDSLRWDDSQGWNNWIWRETNITFGSKAHTYASGIYLVGGQHGEAAWSDDGMATWHILTKEMTTFNDGSASHLYINAAAYGNNRFVIGGGKGHTAVSTDGGKTWTGSPATGRTSPQAIFDSGFIDTMVFAKGMFIALGGMDGQSSKAAYSTDGLAWQQGTIPEYTLINSSDGPRTAVGGGFIIAIDNYGNAAYSANGKDWAAMDIGFEGYVPTKDIAYGNGRFVIVGNGGNAAYCVVQNPQ
jgi:hypothetical protein